MTDLKLNLNDVESNNQEEPLMNGQINIKDDNLLYFYSLKKIQIAFFNETDTKEFEGE